jgi:hypothetical protein
MLVLVSRFASRAARPSLFLLLNDGYNGVNDTTDLLVCKMIGDGQDKIFVRRENFVWSDEAIDRKPAGTEISGGKRNSRRIEPVFAGNLADDTIITIQIRRCFCFNYATKSGTSSI